jgi:hypothetical protein
MSPYYFLPHLPTMISLNPKRSKRHVLLHDIQDYYDDHDDEVSFDPDTTFDIDCPVSSIQAYTTKLST